MRTQEQSSFQNETDIYSGRLLKNINRLRLFSDASFKWTVIGDSFYRCGFSPIDGGMLPRQTDVSSWFQRYLRPDASRNFQRRRVPNIWPWSFLNTLLGSNICPRFVNVKKNLKKSNIYSILWLGNVDSLVMWVESLDGSREWRTAPRRTGTMFLMCHLLSECSWRQLSTGTSWRERPEAHSRLTPRPWRGASGLHVCPWRRFRGTSALQGSSLGLFQTCHCLGAGTPASI